MKQVSLYYHLTYNHIRMARRKTDYLSDGSDSDGSEDGGGSEGGYNSQEDADSRAERALFEHNGRKRRKVGGGGKESAWEGIFGEGDDDEGGGSRGGRGGRGGRGRGGRGGRTDWTKWVNSLNMSRIELTLAQSACIRAQIGCVCSFTTCDRSQARRGIR
jgi:hypothetical protein